MNEETQTGQEAEDGYPSQVTDLFAAVDVMLLEALKSQGIRTGDSRIQMSDSPGKTVLSTSRYDR